MVSFGDIEGNVIGLNIDEREKLFEVNMHSQKISRLRYLENNLIAAA